jgi:hypothetical protein
MDGLAVNEAVRPRSRPWFRKGFAVVTFVDSVTCNAMRMRVQFGSGPGRFASGMVAVAWLAVAWACGVAAAEEVIAHAAPMDRLVSSPVRLEAKMVASSSSSDTWRDSYYPAYRTDVESARTVEARVAGFSTDMPKTVVQCIFFGHDVSSSALKILAIEQAEVTQPEETFTFSAVAGRSHGAGYYATRRWRQGDSLTGWVVRVIQGGRTVAVQPRSSGAADAVAGNSPEFQQMMHAFAGPPSGSSAEVEPWTAGTPVTAATVDAFLEQDLRLPAWKAAARRSDWKAGRPDGKTMASLLGSGKRHAALLEKAEAMLADAKGAVERKYLRAAIDLLSAAEEANVRAMNEALLNLPRK